MKRASLVDFFSRYRLILLNALMFQLGWLVCILFGSLYALIFTVAASLFHFWLFGNQRADWLYASIALFMGLLHDSLMLATGVFGFAGHFLPPVWLLCLWWLLGLTLRHSLYEIYRRPLLASLLGAVSAGFAYYAGVSLSPISWGTLGEAGVLIIAAAWLVVLPLHRRVCALLEINYTRTEPHD
ncbi:DUF2878 domain-containing protein [Gilvimarinus algae]|uniref:DUF2878 domain-containing protein n=1 Tax=Gilvimarinus algae TaxID=3058037 RepID=A0ABT8TJH5_9GAMM|nr:DUF2878 domain-containing protein [Gilvimarinus sp. SDUM040014]MDO3382497.1 DUF2878 domain-containing protein [Gilvimarinus sp. SDUM040014]